MRWKSVLVGLALTFAATTGCKQQCFVTECDLNHYRNDLGLPPNLPGNPEAAIIPTLGGGPPATVDSPERKPRYMTLQECLALALEQGTTNPFGTTGTIDDSVGSFAGTTFAPSANPIRVLALNPAISGADIEDSLSKFDAVWQTSMTWQRNETPAGGNIITNFNNGDIATLTSSVLKPLPTGGVAGITFNTSYTLLTTPPFGFLNPQYRPSLQFQFEQPLLQGWGVEINQLRAAHPGSILTPFAQFGTPTEGILITRLRFDENRAEFQRQVHYLVVNVEAAYWNLYGSYWALYSREQALRQAYETWKINRQRFEAGRISRQDLAQTRQQYETFRGQRITALGVILEDERQLRLLLGLEPEDGTRLVPIDTPTLAPYQPDWESAVNDAMVLRPELVLARQDLKFRQLDLIRQKDLLMPDLRFTSTYDVNGLGTHLDGGAGDPNNALHSLATNEFHDWSLGLRLNVPIGFRNAHANVRIA
ncbi:MAG TPA: TolC family protein, partial [Gemmataceae bacterium]|nr:TolC family protein [Gemmataceae bacterium]